MTLFVHYCRHVGTECGIYFAVKFFPWPEVYDTRKPLNRLLICPLVLLSFKSSELHQMTLVFHGTVNTAL